jgi:hypothetical protein
LPFCGTISLGVRDLLNLIERSTAFLDHFDQDAIWRE